MCGISCIIDPAAYAGLASDLAAMHSRIRHRGPDGEGFVYVDGDGSVSEHAPSLPVAGLAFRWLKIQDTSDQARQPFSSPDGRIRLLFNGEVYNFGALREELARDGFVFHTHSDTEVVVAAYERWGTECFARFRGMWAIVLLDLVAGVVVVSRDRFGIKPLHYRVDGTRLSLASEVKQLLTPGGARLDREMFLHFIAGSRLAGSEHTFFDGIRAVPPGTFAVIALGAQPELSFVPFWSLRGGQGDRRGMTFDLALEELRVLMREVVALHITAEVSVGTFLSGGIDSSVVTALAHDIGAKLPSFSMFLDPEFARYDESRFIRATADFLGVRNAAVVVTGAAMHEHFDRVCAVHEEPLAGMALIAQNLTYALAAEQGVRVVLDGQGSDEEFAGYPRQASEVLLDLFLRMRWLRGGRELAAFARHDPRELQRLARLAASVLVVGPLGLRRSKPRFPWLALSSRKVEQFAHSERDASKGAPGATRLDRILYADTTSLNLYDVLGIGDRNSMAHSIESRVPFVDHVLTEFAFTLPDEMKIGDGWRKRILRRLAARYVPAEVAWRTDKMGFAVPQAVWMRRHFAEELRALADRDVIASSPLFVRDQLRDVARCFLGGQKTEAAFPLWRVLAAARWAEIYGVDLA